MKKRNLLVLLLIVCLGLTGCNKKMTEGEIKKALEVNNEERVFIVNKVTYASDNVNIKDILVKVENNSITLGDYTYTSKGEKYKQIIGYYDQPGAVYHIYVLGEDTVWEIQKNTINSLNDDDLVNKKISKATDLVLIDCEETTKSMGETPLKYQVYALVNNELVLVD